MQSLGLQLIVAFDKNGVIGNKGSIPWHLSEDLKNFKRITTGNVIVMGRKTWDSLPVKPLPNRISIVLSSTLEFKHPDVIVCKDFDSLICIANEVAKDKSIFVIGGESIYRKVLEEKLTDRLHATEVCGEYEGDTYFPMKFLEDFKKDVVIEKDGFSFCEYSRK